MNGVDWTMDPGYGPKGDYPGYSDNAPGGRRWTYAQTQPHWHSTLRVGTGLGQQVGPTAAITGSGTSATVDLSRALSGVSSASRSLSLNPTSMTIRDRVVTKKAQTLSWGWMTDAGIAISGRTVTLTKSGRTLTLTWSGLPSGATITVEQVPVSLRYLTGSLTQLVAITIPATTKLDLTTTAAWSQGAA